MPESNPDVTDSEPSREELDVELPVDWGELKAEVLRRDGGECAICGTGADERQLYVLYSRPPSYPSRVQPSASDAEGSADDPTTEIEVPGHGTDNMVTVCEIHAVGGRKDGRTVVVPDEARAAKNASVDVDADADADVVDGDGVADAGIDGTGNTGGRGDERESGFDRDAEVEDGVRGDAIAFPERGVAGDEGESGTDGEGLASRFGMADEFSSAMDAVSGSESDAPADADSPSVPSSAAPGPSSGSGARASRDSGTGSGAGAGGDDRAERNGPPDDTDFTRSFHQRRFGLHLPFVGRTLRVIRALAWVAVSVTLSSGAVAALIGGVEAGAETVLRVGGAIVGIAAAVLSSPSVVLGAFALGYGVHLWYRDGVYSAWPLIRESPPPTVAGRRLLVSAGVTTLLGIAVSVYGGLSSLGPVLGSASAPVSVTMTGAAVSVLYAVGATLTMKTMSDAVVADRKAGSAVRAFAWEFPVRVGGVTGIAIAVTGTFAPAALIGSPIPASILGAVAIASVLISPVAAAVYFVRRRAWPTTRGVPVEFDSGVRV